MNFAKGLSVITLLVILVATVWGEFSHDHSEDVTAIKKLLNDIEERIKDQMEHQNNGLKEAIESLQDNVAKLKDSWEEASHVFAAHESKVTEADITLKQAQESLNQAKNTRNEAKHAYEDALIDANLTEDLLRQEKDKKKAHLEAELVMIEKLRTILRKLLSRSIKAEGEHCDELYKCIPGLFCSSENKCTKNECETDQECENSACQDGRCQATAGETCSSSNECYDSDCVQGTCLITSTPRELQRFFNFNSRTVHCGAGSSYTNINFGRQMIATAIQYSRDEGQTWTHLQDVVGARKSTHIYYVVGVPSERKVYMQRPPNFARSCYDDNPITSRYVVATPPGATHIRFVGTH